MLKSIHVLIPFVGHAYMWSVLTVRMNTDTTVGNNLMFD